jgi:Ca2+-binding EF-hand superfamily protein
MRGSKVAASKGSQKQMQKTNWKDRVSQADYDALKETFDLFDADGGGTIDPEEIEKVM